MHHLNILFLRHGFGHFLVDFIEMLRTEFNHLIHGAVASEGSILIAVDAVIFVFASIGIGAENFLCERHPAALTELHSFTHN